MGKSEIKKLSFNPRARLIRTIGDKLITGPEAAVIELVKNAHDADASYVKITFVPPLNRKGSIIIEDDGHGMTLDVIENKWMEPATEDKLIRKSSPKYRPLLGSKGIGRFATAKLGSNLELETTAYDPSLKSNQTLKIYDINWDDFLTKTYISDVSFNCEIASPRPKTGTKLKITSLQDNWTKQRLENLHTELRRLMSPLETKYDFKIFLDLSFCTMESCGFDGFELFHSNVSLKTPAAEHYLVKSYPLLRACDYEVEGEFDKKGKFKGTFTIHRAEGSSTKLEFQVPNPSSDPLPSCGRVGVHLYIFDREKQAIEGIIKRAGLGEHLSLKAARAILDEACGVSIYRDQFRIRPYGDHDKDWLTLDKRRVQNPSLRIGHNQIAGILTIQSEDESGLIEQSSREGFAVSDNLRRLHQLILELLAYAIEPRRQQFREKAGLDRRKEDKFQTAHKAAEFKWVQKIIQDLPVSKRAEAERILSKKSLSLEQLIADLESRQTKLEEIATLGLIIREVIHEGKNSTFFIQQEILRLIRWWPKIFLGNEEAESLKQQIPKIHRGLDENSNNLVHLFNLLRPLSGGDRGKPRVYNPNQAVKDCLYLFESRINMLKVAITHTDDATVGDIYGYQTDIMAALTNILDNAFFWLEHSGTNNPEIKIKVSSLTKDLCIIQIEDNGPGIPEEFIDKLFDTGFSLKPNGTGLGLSIAREAVSRSGGDIEFLPMPKQDGARFLIKVPYRIAE